MLHLIKRRWSLVAVSAAWEIALPGTIMGSMNEEELVKQERGTEVVLLDRRQSLPPVAVGGRRLNLGDRMPCWGELLSLNGHFWKILDDPPI